MVLNDQRDQRNQRNERDPYDEQIDEQAEGYDKLDSELAIGYAPTLAELVALSREELSHWLDYVERDPSLDKLRINAARIAEAIQMASGLPEVEHLAAKLALAVDVKFERLKMGGAWYPRLMALYASLMV